MLLKFFRDERDCPDAPKRVDELPALVRHRPVLIHDVAMAKFSTAVLTRDPMNNLHICGIGRGGRLGLGDENTRFRLVPVGGPFQTREVVAVALSDYHSMAVTSEGKLWTWGSNSFSQLGLALPTTPIKSEEPKIISPRQVFGPLKKEFIRGIAASPIHSVAHTASALYCWGKNNGQLGIMDSDSRSLEIQTSPRRVAASLFSCGITMVSAIQKATSILLQNHRVCIFAQFGYIMVKFPFDEVINHVSLSDLSISPRCDPRYRRQIKSIASGGSTIAALSGGGDLFTLHVNDVSDSSESSRSTTNPTKIKNAVSKPQCIWVASKDAIASVDVGEHGSVIISTESGACWRRVKRQTSETGYSLATKSKRSDFKFQRVPCITGIVKVRASTFGAWAAIRKDSDVMKQKINVAKPSLWDDIGALCCLEGFAASGSSQTNPDTLRLKPMESKTLGAVASEILKSADIEVDLASHLAYEAPNLDGTDVSVRTASCPDLEMPLHGWVLAARSNPLCRALSKHRATGLEVKEDGTWMLEDRNGRILITFSGLDILSLLNVVLFAYQDKIIPIWNYTGQKPRLAHYFRQVRVEVMKVASRLGMPGLENAARLQLLAAKSLLSVDLDRARKDGRFFHDADIRLEVDGDDFLAHSSLLCARSPFFQGLFHGRAQGAWLAGRREVDPEGKIRIDFKHMMAKAFTFVLRYLYADTGIGMFDELVSSNIDEFAEVVLEVLGIADELMLDRLSQICQYVIGKFVTMRNISQLLNEISPCSVTEFKNAGLEYILRQMEGMLENKFLQDLEPEVMAELDRKVRQHQARCISASKSNLTGMALQHKALPELAWDGDEECYTRAKEMSYFESIDDDGVTSSCSKGRFRSFEDFGSTSPTTERERRKSCSAPKESLSPVLRPRMSSHDLIFDMDEDEEDGEATHMKALHFSKPTLEMADARVQEAQERSTTLSSSPTCHRTRQLPAQASTTSPSVVSAGQAKGGSPWASTVIQPVKVGLKEIMSEASAAASASGPTTGVPTQRRKEFTPGIKSGPTKTSQKDRKGQQQFQLQRAAEVKATTARTPEKTWETLGAKPSPWKVKPVTAGTSWKDILSGASEPGSIAQGGQAKANAATESSAGKLAPRRTASPDTRFCGQARKATLTPTDATRSKTLTSGSSASSSAAFLAPRASNYTTASKVGPALALSMAEIIGQQQREQEIVKEAVAKRSLVEIQQEQEFQEWWDQESRRTQEEMARRAARNREKEERDKAAKGRGCRGGRRGGCGRTGARSAGGKPAAGLSASTAQAAVTGAGGRGKRGRGRATSNSGSAGKASGDAS